MNTFRVHFVNGMGQASSVEIEAHTPDAAKAEFERRDGKRQILKIKRVRS